MCVKKITECPNFAWYLPEKYVPDFLAREEGRGEPANVPYLSSPIYAYGHLITFNVSGSIKSFDAYGPYPYSRHHDAPLIITHALSHKFAIKRLSNKRVASRYTSLWNTNVRKQLLCAVCANTILRKGELAKVLTCSWQAAIAILGLHKTYLLQLLLLTDSINF